ncbi:methyltransferase domain-containing protein [Microtetraspora malaysiensis]|uniref:Methyltransferase domain-containing protein n=1 Tax=Microtetraspora malaysiensis TaxID=161358 RepID=A0ABW6T275_9ACTN
MPDPDLGERVCACVAVSDGVPPPTPAQLTTYLRDERRLEPRELPEHYLVLPELPLGPTGKVCAATLVRMAAESAVPARPVPHAPPTEETSVPPTTETPARRVGPTGTVVATDIKPERIPDEPGLEIRRHDIVRDPLPEAEFDLVHARLVLLHLPERVAVLDRLVRALKPGGVLQLDEFDITYGPALLMPDPAARRLYETFLAAKIRLMTRAGADVAWGRNAPAAMRAAGLTGIDPRPRLDLWTADSPGVHLISHHTRHLRDRFVEEGMTDRQLADVRTLLADPGFRATSCVMYSVQGRRPVAAG